MVLGEGWQWDFSDVGNDLSFNGVTAVDNLRMSGRAAVLEVELRRFYFGGMSEPSRVGGKGGVLGGVTKAKK